MPKIQIVKKLPYCTIVPGGPPTVQTENEIALRDCPWRFKNWSMEEQAKQGEKWGRAKGRSPYDVIETEELALLPLEKIMAKDAVLLDWVTFPKLEDALEVTTYRRNARGTPIWTYKTIGMVWVKTTAAAYQNHQKVIRWLNEGKLEPEDIWKWITGQPIKGIPSLWHFGSGFWTHGNVECCVIYTRGKGASFRVNADVSQLIVAPIRAHSAKPQEQYAKIDRLLGTDRKRIELFARASNPPPSHWAATGLEFDGQNIWDALGAKEWHESLLRQRESERKDVSFSPNMSDVA